MGAGGIAAGVEAARPLNRRSRCAAARGTRSCLDARRTGCRTRLLRLAPGTRTPEAHAHDYWEEIYLLEGDMTVADPHGGERLVQAPSYACRQPGFMHGPVRTDRGCLLLEFSWY
jgi:quercetin dioxygenase-like cupin family protein